MDIDNTLLGYAQFPDAPNELGVGVNNSANTDAVVVDYTTVGSSVQNNPAGGAYDEGRTLTHEVGHWLGLRHIWGDVDCTTDDFVFDTPRAGGPNFGCPATTTNSCNDITYGAAADSNDMVKNYMDYTDDACMNIFTIGQKNRMRVVMGETGAGAPRRASLRLSDRCQSGPKVSLVLTDTTVMEKTNCLLNWGYSIPVSISRAPNATTTVTLTQTSGSADGNDISISPASVEFTTTDSAVKYFTVMVNADAVFEGVIDMAYFNLNVSGSNATAAADSFELMIMNDDWQPNNGKRFPATLLLEDFENTLSGWITNDYVVGNNKWVLGGTNGNMNGSKSAYISSNNSSLQYDAASTSHSIFYREIDATLYDSLFLSLWYKSYGEKTAGINYDYGKIVYSTDSISFHQLNGTTDLVDSSNMTQLSVQLPYFLWNRKFYIGFYWENDNVVGNNPPFTVDDIAITGKRWMPSMIQTAVDTTASYDEKPVGPMQTVDFYDKVTGDVLATIQDLGGYNWGCVKVEIDRAGTGAQWVTGDPQTMIQTKLFDKTYKVTPTNNNSTGLYKITFYLTQAEVNGWQLASGNGFPIAKIIKYSGRINDMTYSSTYEQKNSVQAAYLGGSDRTISSTFNSGFSGFGFGNIPPVILPVQILSFTAKERNKTVDLKWRVENEQNMDHYTVLRSTDGRNFEPAGNLSARGTNNGIAEYILNDPNPSKGKNYYQLVSYNIDGSFKKSAIVEVVIKNNIIYTVTPNPFSKQIKISAASTAAEKISVSLTDIFGKRILKKQNLIINGEMTIDIPAINPGVYLLQITDSEGTHITKLVKE
jgi:hypothetical protein